MSNKKTNFELVADFMTKFDQPVPTTPAFPSDDVQALRIELIREEFKELRDAIKDKKMVKVADGLTDLLVVIYGAGHAFGIDLDACFAAVMESNMTKLGADGKPVKRADGKIIKGPNFEPPEPKLEKILGIEKTV